MYEGFFPSFNFQEEKKIKEDSYSVIIINVNPKCKSNDNKKLMQHKSYIILLQIKSLISYHPIFASMTCLEIH